MQPYPHRQGTVRHAEWLHQQEWWECADEEDEEAAKHLRIYQKLRAQHQTVGAFCEVGTCPEFQFQISG